MEASNVSSATSSTHDLSSSAASSPEEFYVPVELYLSKTAMAARKVRLPASLFSLRPQLSHLPPLCI